LESAATKNWFNEPERNTQIDLDNFLKQQKPRDTEKEFENLSNSNIAHKVVQQPVEEYSHAAYNSVLSTERQLDAFLKEKPKEKV